MSSERTPLVLHLIDELRTGGAQTHLVTVLREWQRLKRSRHVVVSLFGDGSGGDSLREMGLEVIVLDLAGLIRSGRFWRAQDEILQLLRRQRPDIIEAHLTYSRLLGLFAAARAKIPRRYGFEHGDIYLRSWKWRIANFIGQFFATKTVVCSPALGDWVRRTHAIFNSRLIVIDNCVDPEAFKPSASPQVSRQGLGLPSDAFVFCAVGTLGRGVNKRVDVCIRALAEMGPTSPRSCMRPFSSPTSWRSICRRGAGTCMS